MPHFTFIICLETLYPNTVPFWVKTSTYGHCIVVEKVRYSLDNKTVPKKYKANVMLLIP